MDLANDLADAVERGQIEAYFQPQVDVVSGAVVAAEALARWNHPVHGFLEPDLFIPVAEQNGLLDDLGVFMVDEAWRCAAQWANARRPIDVSVNASATQLETEALTEHLERQAARYRLRSGTLIVEITETREFDDLAAVASRLARLRAHGIGISIDDFGAGFSTLARLDALPATELKVDISLVQDETTEGYGALIEVVEHAHDRGIRVVAEGVETEGQRRRVELLRCQRAQGFLFARPMTEAAFGKLLTRPIR